MLSRVSENVVAVDVEKSIMPSDDIDLVLQ